MEKTFDWGIFLRRTPIFSGLKEEQIKQLIVQLLKEEISRERKYIEGSVIFQEGEFSDSFFLIGVGSVQVTVRGGDDFEIILSVLKQGEFFGEMALLEGKPRSATVRARESCILLEIKGQEFLQLINQYRDIETKILLKLSERLRYTNDQVLNVKLKDISEKIDQLNAKLGEEVRVIDSRLQTTQALFDQTKLRTDEVINSAERSRTRLTTTVSTIGAVIGIAVTLFGWLGFSELLSIRKESKEISDIRQKIAEAVGKTENDLKKVDQYLPQFKMLRTNFYRQIMIPRFQEEMISDPHKANYYYKSILETEDSDITDYLFDRSFLLNIISDNKDIRKNSREILQEGIRKNYVKNPRQTILSYYFILLALILDKADNREEFRKIFSDYTKYLRDYDGQSVKDSLKKFLIFEGIDNLLKRDSDERTLFETIKNLIP